MTGTRSTSLVTQAKPVIARRMRDGAYAVYGSTAVGRRLVVFLAPRANCSYYVVTARDATSGERRRFRW